MYNVLFNRLAARQLPLVPEPPRSRLTAAIGALGADPRPNGCQKLKGLDTAYRIRVGSYRAVYTISDTESSVTVVRIGHRRNVYEGN